MDLRGFSVAFQSVSEEFQEVPGAFSRGLGGSQVRYKECKGISRRFRRFQRLVVHVDSMAHCQESI